MACNRTDKCVGLRATDMNYPWTCPVSSWDDWLIKFPEDRWWGPCWSDLRYENLPRCVGMPNQPLLEGLRQIQAPDRKHFLDFGYSEEREKLSAVLSGLAIGTTWRTNGIRHWSTDNHVTAQKFYQLQSTPKSSPFLIQGPNLIKGKANRLGFDWSVSIDRFRFRKLHTWGIYIVFKL